MKRVLLTFLALAAGLSATSAIAASGYRLAPWKDDLFKYPALLSSDANGDNVVVQYNETRDLNQRDTIPEKQARPEYVSLDPKAYEKDMVLSVGDRTTKYIFVGKSAAKAKAIVIYVHGRGGNRFQGANDGMFGGNFNRIKNLMVRNGGIYLSPEVHDLGAPGVAEVKALMLEYSRQSPGAPIFLSCGSLGGRVCWAIALDPEASALLGGLILMGSTHDDRFLKSPAIKGGAKRFPIYLGHGNHDPILNWRDQAAFYRKVRAAAPDYPIRFALFDTGTHGTPIRMTDWRLILNWMLQVDGK